jgi:hypothetical protein
MTRGVISCGDVPEGKSRCRGVAFTWVGETSGDVVAVYPSGRILQSICEEEESPSERHEHKREETSSELLLPGYTLPAWHHVYVSTLVSPADCIRDNLEGEVDEETVDKKRIVEGPSAVIHLNKGWVHACMDMC